MDYGALLQMVMSGVGAAGAGAVSAEDREQARQMLQKMMAKYDQIKAPQLQDAPAQELGQSAFSDIHEDPRLRDAEMGGLDSLKQMQDAGGLTLEDTAALNSINDKTARREAAGRGAIANDFASRGQLGSGAQLAMSLQSQQDSANRSADAGANTAASAQRRYFDSVLARGKMAGDMSGRDYQRQADAARARDSIAAHNAAARTDAARYHNDVLNQGFSNQMGLTGAQAGAGYKQANYLQNEASRKAEQFGRAASGISKAAGSLWDDDEEKK